MRKLFKNAFCVLLGGAMLLTTMNVPVLANDILVGDVNQDAYIGLDDARIIFEIAAPRWLDSPVPDVEIDPEKGISEKAADFNGDGEYKLDDVMDCLEVVLKGYAADTPIKAMENISDARLECVKKGNGVYECSVITEGDLLNFDYGVKYDAEKVSNVTVRFDDAFLNFYNEACGMTFKVLDEERGYITLGGLTNEPINYNGRICTIAFYAEDENAEIGIVKNSANVDFDSFMDAADVFKLSEAFGLLKGDVNMDGKLDLTDAQMTLAKALGISDTQISGAEDESVYDIDGNGIIDLADATYCLNLALGIV